MGELLGVLSAVLSSGLGGTAIVATRFVVGVSDPLTVGVFRFGAGAALLLPLLLLRRDRLPARADWPGVLGLGLLFFALFPVLFNAALIHTTAARGALALSTLPLLTMLAAAALRVEALTPRKSLGVLVAMLGVASALLSGLATAPAGAWRGDLLMVAAALCMALHSVWSKPYIRRAGPLAFTTVGMVAGALCLAALAWLSGGFAAVARFGAGQWLAVSYLGVVCGAAIFLLWSIALQRTTPTRVAISITVNPVTATTLGAAILGEPIGWNVALGLVAVFLGIWLATTAGAGRVAASAR